MIKNLLIVILLIVIVMSAVLYEKSHIKTAIAPTVSTSTPTSVVTAKPIASVSYTCDGGHTLHATFYAPTTTPPVIPGEPPKPGGSVDLTPDAGKSMHLLQTISADGARYANEDESFIFWSKGSGALVLEHDKEGTYTNCVEIAPLGD